MPYVWSEGPHLSLTVRNGVKRDKPRLIVFPHILDGTGAPQVLMELLRDLRKEHPSLGVTVVALTMSTASDVEELESIGVEVVMVTWPNCTFDFAPGDIVLMNSRGHTHLDLPALLESNELRKIFWFIHEPDPEIFDSVKDKMTALLRQGRLEFFTPALQSLKNIQKYFKHTQDTYIQSYRMTPPYKRILAAGAFSESLNAVVAGVDPSGRKGHIPLIYAYIAFFQQIYSRNPDLYRNPRLTLVGLTGSHGARQMCEHAFQILGNRFTIFPPVPHEECLNHILAGNLTICASVAECLPIFVFEGMFAGHPILRNGCSGVDEQLVDGENGYFFDSWSFNAIVQGLEKIHNRSKTPDLLLQRMSSRSLEIASGQEAVTYSPLFDRMMACLT